LPRSVSRALEQVRVHPDAGLVLPSALPAKADLEQAERIMAERLRPVEEQDAKRCFAKLLTTFEPNTKLGGPETKIRFVAWLEALRDVPGDLWAKATDNCIASLEWMPKPAQFRAQVDGEIAERARQARLLKDLKAATGQPFVREPPEVRLRGLIQSYRKIGNERRAKELELELQALLMDSP
jgi:hypothetical protein